ncbi:MAG: cation diffusion facilitator family transporter [Bacteroidota bacterium]
MSHNHHHLHHHNSNLKIAFFLNLGFTIFEVIGGFYVNSVAIISDAIHDLGDSLSLGSAWYLEKKSKQKPDNNFTFGYKRFSLLGALINSLILILGSFFVIQEAISRILTPEPTNAMGMVTFAIIGVVVNGYAAWKLKEGNSLNEKVVSWHLIEDVLGWIAVLIAAIVLLIWDIPFLDPALSLAISLFILWNVLKRLKETMHIFLQGAPKKIKLQELTNKITSLDFIDSIHHTHLWSLDGEENVFTTHIRLKESVHYSQLLDLRKAVKKRLKPYNFRYLSVEIEEFSDECILQ